MSDSKIQNREIPGISRRNALQLSAGTVLTTFGGPQWAYAADQPAMGTWPEGSKGDRCMWVRLFP